MWKSENPTSPHSQISKSCRGRSSRSRESRTRRSASSNFCCPGAETHHMNGFSSKPAMAILGLLITAAPGQTQGTGARTRPDSSPEGGDRATPRASEGAGERAVPRATETDTSSRPADTSNNPPGANDVANWSRPRGDQPATDVAAPRVGPRPPRDSGDRNRKRVPDVSCASYYIGCGDDSSYPPYYVYGVPLYWYDVGDGIPDVY